MTPPAPTGPETTGTPARTDVRKTYKLYIGGAFPRSESGHSYEVRDTDGGFLANASLASRKDVRDAVVAAHKAFPGWSGRTPVNRGQVLYRVAEVLEDRRAQFEVAVQRAEGADSAAAAAVVDASVDRLVWYAGWADKLAQVVGGVNPVAGPFLNLSSPEPTGVVGVLGPQSSSLLGLVSVVAPVVVTGNTAVVVTSHRRPLPAVTLGEVLATSDLPGGVVNLLTGSAAALGSWLASHADVQAVDLGGIAGLDGAAPDLPRTLEEAAAGNLKRVRRAPAAEPDWTAAPLLDAMTDFVETKTVWHPRGL